MFEPAANISVLAAVAVQITQELDTSSCKCRSLEEVRVRAATALLKSSMSLCSTHLAACAPGTNALLEALTVSRLRGRNLHATSNVVHGQNGLESAKGLIANSPKHLEGCSAASPWLQQASQSLRAWTWPPGRQASGKLPGQGPDPPGLAGASAGLQRALPAWRALLPGRVPAGVLEAGVSVDLFEGRLMSHSGALVAI